MRQSERSPLGCTFVDHLNQLRAAAQKIVGSRQVADEVTQDAYLKVSQLTQEVVIQQPLAYCYQIVRNLAIDYRRRMSMESHVFAHEDDGIHVPTPQGTPEQLAIGRQHLRIVDKVLSELPARTRQAFEMHRLNGLTQRDIAHHMGVSATLVNFMIKDASQALMQCRHLLVGH